MKKIPEKIPKNPEKKLKNQGKFRGKIPDKKKSEKNYVRILKDDKSATWNLNAVQKKIFYERSPVFSLFATD